MRTTKTSWVATIVLTCAFAPPAATSAPHPIIKDLGDCQQCHNDGKDHRLKPLHAEKCLGCHQAQDLATRRPGGARPTPPNLLTLNPEKQSFGTVSETLKYPLYSTKSRLGGKPNRMIRVPAGDFTRGTNERLADEGPQHTVHTRAFFIDAYEVTNLQYQRFIEATDKRSPTHFRNRTFPPGKADHPVTFVTWYDANSYCQWANKRLPTDTEWEKAARGTDGRRYAWGNSFDINSANTPQRWGALKKQGDTTPVGAFESGRSPYGLYDMSGNVWEWTSSWYQAYPGNTRKTENYGEQYKTLKGGSWWDCSFYKCGISAPVYNRSFFLRNTKNNSFGFRCAKDT